MFEVDKEALDYAKDQARALVINPNMGALKEAYAEIAENAVKDYLSKAEKNQCLKKTLKL